MHTVWVENPRRGERLPGHEQERLPIRLLRGGASSNASLSESERTSLRSGLIPSARLGDVSQLSGRYSLNGEVNILDSIIELSPESVYEASYKTGKKGECSA